MKLGAGATYPSLEGVSLCGNIPMPSVCVPSGFGGRAGSEVSMGHIFPWGVLAATTLLDDMAGDGGVRVRARCEPGLLLCSVAVTTLSAARAEALRV